MHRVQSPSQLMAVIRALPDGRHLVGRRVALSPEMIAVTRTLYPDGDKLHKNWGL